MSVKINFELGHEASIRTKRTQEGFTHDWEVFVRGCDGDISHFIEKVVFHLHETFPKPRRVVKEPPYKVKESGYAGFNFPIDIYLKNKDEPKKIRFFYDLDLQPAGPTIFHTQKEKYVFHHCNEEFRYKLMKGGGIPGSPENGEITNNDCDTSQAVSASSSDPPQHQTSSPPNQLINKPNFSLPSTLNASNRKNPPSSEKSEKSSTSQNPSNFPPKLANFASHSNSFNELFGIPIKKTSNFSQNSKTTTDVKREKSFDKKSEKKEKNASSKTAKTVKEKSDKGEKSEKVKDKSEKIEKFEKKEEKLEKIEKVSEKFSTSSVKSEKVEKTDKFLPQKSEKAEKKEKSVEKHAKSEKKDKSEKKSKSKSSSFSNSSKVKSSSSSSGSKSKEKSEKIEKVAEKVEKVERKLEEKSKKLEKFDDKIDKIDKKEEKKRKKEEDYLVMLRGLQSRIMALNDNQELQKVVELIAETGRYEISQRTFDFDLCLLERETVRKLQEFFAL